MSQEWFINIFLGNGNRLKSDPTEAEADAFTSRQRGFCWSLGASNIADANTMFMSLTELPWLVWAIELLLVVIVSLSNIIGFYSKCFRRVHYRNLEKSDITAESAAEASPGIQEFGDTAIATLQR